MIFTKTKFKICTFLILFLILIYLIPYMGGGLQKENLKSQFPFLYRINSVEWTEPQIATKTSTGNVLNYDMTIDSQGNVHLVFLDDTDDLLGSGDDLDVFYTWWSAISQCWSSYELVSEGSTATSYLPKISTDNSGSVYIIWTDATNNYQGSGADFDVFYRKRDHITQKWSTIEVISTLGTSPSYSYEIFVDKFNDVHTVILDYENILGASTDPDLFYRKRANSTGTWQSYELISVDSTNTYYDRVQIINDSYNNIHIIWDESAEFVYYHAFYRFRNSITGTWLPIEQVCASNNRQELHCDLAIDSSNNIHVIYSTNNETLSSSGSDYDIFHTIRNNTDKSWSNPQLVSSSSGDHNSDNPSIFIDTKNNIHVVWDDKISNIDYEIRYKCWNQSINEWESDMIISDDVSPSDVSRYPIISGGKFDTLHIVWRDNVQYKEAYDDFVLGYDDIFHTHTKIIDTSNSGTSSDTSTDTITDTNNSQELWLFGNELPISPDLFFLTLGGICVISIFLNVILVIKRR